MTTQQAKKVSAVFGAIKIAMDRAYNSGMSPDELIQSMITNHDDLMKLTSSCYDYLNKKY